MCQVENHGLGLLFDAHHHVMDEIRLIVTEWACTSGVSFASLSVLNKKRKKQEHSTGNLDPSAPTRRSTRS
jgi:hypothetical protein